MTQPNFRPINDQRTFNEVSIERAIQAAVGGGCSIPLGIHARIENDRIDLNLSLGNEQGAILIHDTLSAPLSARDTLISQAVDILSTHR